MGEAAKETDRDKHGDPSAETGSVPGYQEDFLEEVTSGYHFLFCKLRGS